MHLRASSFIYFRSRLVFVAFIITLALGIFFRFYAIGERMTHIDDIGPIENLVSSNSQSEAAENVSNNWTYGPSQFRMSWYIIQGAHNWSDLVARARLPSAIFSSLGLCLFAIALWLIDGRSLRWGSVLAFSLCALSCHALIEAQQAHVYASTQFAAAWITLGIVLIRTYGANLWNWIAISSLTALPATWFITICYQNIFLLPGMFLAIAFSLFPRPKERSAVYAQMGVLAILLLVSAWYVKRIYIFKMLPLQKQEYRSFPVWAHEGRIELSSNLVSNLINGFQFEFQRLGNFLFYQTTPVWPSAFSSQVIFGVQCIMIGTVFFGLFQIVRQCKLHPHFDLQHLCKLALTLFSAISIGIFVILCTIDVLPFGATRHSHLLLIPGVWLLKTGLDAIFNFFNVKATIALGIAVSLWIATVSAFSVYRDEFVSSTKNNYDVAYLDGICKSQAISKFYEVEWTWDYAIASQRFRDQYSCPRADRIDKKDVVSTLKAIAEDPTKPSVMFSSHRFDLVTTISNAAKNPLLTHLRFHYLKNVLPIGSTEPIGNVNGGNGFYVVVVD